MKKLGRLIIHNIALAGFVLGGVDLHAMMAENAPIVVEGITEQPAVETSVEMAQLTGQEASDRDISQRSSIDASDEAPLREALAKPVDDDESNMAAIAAGVAGAALGAGALAGLGYLAYQKRTIGTGDLLDKQAELKDKLDAAQDDPKKAASIKRDLDAINRLLDEKTKKLSDEKDKIVADQKKLMAKVIAADKNNQKPLTDSEEKRLRDADKRLVAIEVEQKKIAAGPSVVKKSSALKVAKAIVTQDVTKLKKLGGDSALAKASTSGKWTRAGSYTSGDLRRDAKSAYSRAKTAISGPVPERKISIPAPGGQPVRSRTVTTVVQDRDTTPKPTSSDDALNKLRTEASQKAVDARSEPAVEPIKKTPPPPPTTPKPPVPAEKTAKPQSLTTAQQAQKDAETKRATTALKPLDNARMIQNKQGGYVGQALTGRVQ